MIVLPVAAAAFAGLMFAVFNAILGSDAKYKQVFAIIVYSGAIVALGALFVLPIDYFRESLASPTTLMVFLLPFPSRRELVRRTARRLDRSIPPSGGSSVSRVGLGVLYRKRTGPIAFTLLALYGAIALVIAAIQSAVSGA